LRPHSIIRTLAAAALIAVPSLAMAAPDQNTTGNPGQYNTCQNGRWVNGQCVYNNNNNNGQWNNGRHRNRDRNDEERGDNRDNGRHHGWNNNSNNNNNNNNNGNWNNNGNRNGGYNGGYNNGYNGGTNNGYNNNQLSGTVSSFSPYNLYLNNGVHVVLHNGTVINPTGTNLTGGQRVRVYGTRNGDGTFSADRIDVIGGAYGNGYRYLR
jgi:hypothetical protein